MKSIVVWALAVALGGVVFTSSAFAQTLPQVSVITTRSDAAPFDVPASVDVIDGERLRGAGRPEINLSEGLGMVPGVSVRERQNYAQDLQLSIRGFGARSTFGVRGIRLYVDGIPATMPDGQGQLSHIDLSSAGRIELLRGPFSGLYGNSSGGVLQVFTEPGEGSPRLTTSVAFGSDKMARPGLRLSGSSGALGYVISANHFSTDGWRDHSAASRGLLNARLDWKPTPGNEWNFVANSQRLRADDPLGLTRAQSEAAPRTADTAATLFNTRKTVEQNQLGLVHERGLSGGDRLRLMVYGGERRTEQFQAIPVAAQASPLHPGGVIGLARQYGGADLRWTRESSLLGGPLKIAAGLSYDGLKEHRQGWQNFSGATLGVQGALRRDEDNEVSNIDPYLQAVWKFAPRWTLTAGIRHSRVRFSSSDQFIVGPNGNDSGSVRYAATLPAAGLMYALSPRWHVYGALGRGFETPTFNELAYRPDGSAGLNLQLSPSRSNNRELGIKGRSVQQGPWRSEWNAALFQTDTDSEIVTQTNSGGRSTFRNAGATRRRGIELAWSGTLSPGWRFQLAQTWLDARYQQSFATCTATPCILPTQVIAAGNRIPGTARSVSAAEVTWAPAKGWQAGADVRRSSRVHVNDVNSEAAPAFTTLGVHGGYVFDVQGWSLSAMTRVDNALNRRYAGSVIVNEGNGRFYEPAPGRTWTFKMVGSRTF